MTFLYGRRQGPIEFLWTMRLVGGRAAVTASFARVDAMATIDLTRVATPGERLRRTARRSGLLPSRPGRLPLGSFAQGRPLRRALADLLATIAVLVAVIGGLTLLQSRL